MTDRTIQAEKWKWVTDSLSIDEADRLFVEILIAPEWMDYLERVKVQYDLSREGLKHSLLN